MDLYARINILDGLSVRLPHGGLDEAIPLDNDPIGRARHWVTQGINFLHVVDLDAAAYSDYRNRELIARLINDVSVPVQVAGGIRSEAEAQRQIEAGAWRIVMGTAAIENQNMVWDLCRAFPGKIAVSLDVRHNEEVATRGWTQNSGRFLEEVLIEMSSAGVAAYMVAEAGHDALTEPPNYALLTEALMTVEEPVIAAGGVRDLEDLRALMHLEASGRRLQGVVVGREVSAGRFTIDEAKEVLSGGGPTRAPGGIRSTRVRIGVGSLTTALGFYRDTLDFAHVRSPSQGVAVAVLQAAAGQQIELVEGEGARPESVLFKVENLDRWKDHLTARGVQCSMVGAQLEARDPDGLKLVFEPA